MSCPCRSFGCCSTSTSGNPRPAQSMGRVTTACPAFRKRSPSASVGRMIPCSQRRSHPSCSTADLWPRRPRNNGSRCSSGSARGRTPRLARRALRADRKPTSRSCSRTFGSSDRSLAGGNQQSICSSCSTASPAGRRHGSTASRGNSRRTLGRTPGPVRTGRQGACNPNCHPNQTCRMSPCTRRSLHSSGSTASHFCPQRCNMALPGNSRRAWDKTAVPGASVCPTPCSSKPCRRTRSGACPSCKSPNKWPKSHPWRNTAIRSCRQTSSNANSCTPRRRRHSLLCSRRQAN
mmetsp:Transcript_94853/g.245559  ORF Transcript_94853/g.245559 Transcript_94853/m.245559 type:complete len:291 (+) Transcript_94853:1287-2159(+)